MFKKKSAAYTENMKMTNSTARFLSTLSRTFPDKRKAIRNIKTLLKENGRLVMTAWLQNEKPTLAQKEFLIK